MTLALGRHLLESTVFALFIGFLVFCLRKRSAAGRYALWLTAVAKFLLPAAAFSLLGSKLREFLPSTAISPGVPGIISRWMTLGATSNSLTPTRWPFDPLLLIWLTGIVVALFAWVPRLSASVKVSEASSDLDRAWFVRLKQRIGLRRKVRLRFSDSISEPVLAGFWKPAIVIPPGLSESLSAPEFESVILHELAHAKRNDNWMAAFAHVITCIFWFYPLLWWIEKRMHREREFACDEMVVRCGAEPKDYAAGILKVCRFCFSAEVPGISGICRSNLKSRMEAIMSLSPETLLRNTPKPLLGTLVAAIVLVPLLVGFLTSNTYGQAAKKHGQRANQATARSESTCVFASVAYPEGTVIQSGNGPEQMCMRVLNPSSSGNRNSLPTYQAQWVCTSEAIRQRSATVIHLAAPAAPPPFWCSPKTSNQANACACEEGGPFSQGSLVNSAKGPFQLSCDRGHWVQTATHNIERQ